MGRRIDVTVGTLEAQVRSRTSRWGSVSLLRLVENVVSFHLDLFQRSLFLSLLTEPPVQTLASRTFPATSDQPVTPNRKIKSRPGSLSTLVLIAGAKALKVSLITCHIQQVIPNWHRSIADR